MWYGLQTTNGLIGLEGIELLIICALKYLRLIEYMYSNSLSAKLKCRRIMTLIAVTTLTVQ
jgi:hypothetical protein